MSLTVEDGAESAEGALYGFACRHSQAASETCAGEDFVSQITRYRKRCFWTGGGRRFPGSRMGQQTGKYRHDRCLGRGRKVDAGQSLASTDGGQTISFGVMACSQ